MIRYSIRKLALERGARRIGSVRLRTAEYSLTSEIAFNRAINKMLSGLAAEVRVSIVAAYAADRKLTKARTAMENLFQDAPDEAWFTALKAKQEELAGIASASVANILELDGKARDKKFMGEAKRALGIDLSSVIDQEDLRPSIDLATQRSAALITNIGQDTIHRIQQAVYQSETQGLPIKDLQDRLKKEFGFSQKRAKLVARDQINKFGSDLDRLRQQQAGIEEYVWRTSQDERVRPRHRRCNNKTYKWGQPTDAEGGLPPGQPIQCRCVAEGLIRFTSEEANAAVEEGRAEQEVRRTAAREEIERREAAAKAGRTPQEPQQPRTAALKRAVNPAAALTVARAALDKEMQAYVLEKGKDTNTEFLWSYDYETAKPLQQNTTGEKGFVAVPDADLKAMADPKRQIITHHNHPSSSSFSAQDVYMLNAKPGLKGLWAHGHDGSSFYAEAGERIVAKGNRSGPMYEQYINNTLKSLQKDWNSIVQSYVNTSLRGNEPGFKLVSRNAQQYFWEEMQAKGYISEYREVLTPARQKSRNEAKMLFKHIRTEFNDKWERLYGDR